MRKNKLTLCGWLLVLCGGALVMGGCESRKVETVGTAALSSGSTPITVEAVPIPQSVEKEASVPSIKKVVRIKAGAALPFTDSKGNVWAADQGFSGGDTIEHPDLQIANTTEPEIYRSEHYAMDSFSCPLANGNYLVKLHFAETYDGIQGPGQRVFSFSVQGHEFKDFDVWAKAGGPLKAYIESVPVQINDRKLMITFTANIENPQINGIEIIPQS